MATANNNTISQNKKSSEFPSYYEMSCTIYECIEIPQLQSEGI